MSAITGLVPAGAALAAFGAVLLAVPGRPRRGGLAADPVRGVPTTDTEDRGWLLRHRPWWSLLCGVAAAVLLGGPVGLGAGLVVVLVTWVGIGRTEPAGTVLTRAEVRRDLPHVVALLGSALGSGAAPEQALGLVGAALPGAASDRLSTAAGRLAVGVDPALVWGALRDDPELALLGRALGRAHDTGAPVGAAVEQLAVELADRARAELEDRARRVGVLAALPLGLCLLPAFVLLGIVPLVAGLAGSLLP